MCTRARHTGFTKLSGTQSTTVATISEREGQEVDLFDTKSSDDITLKRDAQAAANVEVGKLFDEAFEFDSDDGLGFPFAG